jgi:hypothetical protein
MSLYRALNESSLTSNPFRGRYDPQRSRQSRRNNYQPPVKSNDDGGGDDPSNPIRDLAIQVIDCDNPTEVKTLYVRGKVVEEVPPMPNLTIYSGCSGGPGGS